MEDTTSTVTTQDAGAAPETLPAEAGGTQEVTDTGADTQGTRTAEGAGGEDAETTSQEGQEATEGSKDRGAHQKTLEERAQEIAEKRVAEAEERMAQRMEAMFKERFQPETPDFIPVDKAAYEAHVAEQIELMENLRLEGRTMDALDVDDYVRALRAQYRANAEKEKAWRERGAQREHATAVQQESAARMNAALNEAAGIVRQGLNLSEEAWDVGEKYFGKARQSNPLLEAEYREMVYTQGPVRAIKWAAEWTRQEMGKAAETARMKKEEGKGKTVGGGGETTSGDFGNIRTFNDLLKLPSTEINRFAKEHPKRYQDLKQRHFR